MGKRKKTTGTSALRRRDFLQKSAAGVAGLSLGPAMTGCGDDATSPMSSDGGAPSGSQLRILLWDHFVPGHDVWFDPFAQAWGEANGVEVIITHVPFTEIRGIFQGELEAGEGHDLVEFIVSPSDLEPHMTDVADIVTELESRHGTMIDICKRSCFNPASNAYLGLTHGWAPDPANYRRTLWEGIGMPSGPSTWQELLDGGRQIYNGGMGVPVGFGLAPETDANMATRAILWSFGGSIQDEAGAVSINSMATQEALDFMAQVYRDCMTEDVLTWTAASNNVALVEGNSSYILNSISAYRTAQTTMPMVARDIFFAPALRGPSGTRLVGTHVSPTWTIPNYARNVSAAQDFLLHYIGNYSEVTFNSALYNLPAFPSTTDQLQGETGWLAQDPFDSEPREKLAVLQDAESWSTNIGYPGNGNPAIGEIFSMGILPMMFSSVATGAMTAAEAATWGEEQMAPVFERWRAMGLVA